MHTAPASRRKINAVAAPRALSWCVALLFFAAPLRAQPTPGWPVRLHAALERLDARHRADLGVYVRDLDTGESAAYRADERWYLASMVKLPVAMAVLRAVERGEFTLDTTLRLRAADIVDGAGDTLHHPPGTALSIRYLLEQMVIQSDNTASDMLIGLVGIQAVNVLVQSLVPWGFEPITSLADVRRHVYSQLDPSALRLSGRDFLLLKLQRTEPERRQTLGRLLNVPVAGFRLSSVGQAYEAYYAGGLNAGRLDAYGELLAQLVRGKALNPLHTAYLLDVMDRVVTGRDRLRAGLPVTVRFAHKTGTQYARVCDAGLVTVPRSGREQRIVVVACTRGEPTLATAERALKQVATALCRSGLLTDGNPHDAVCDTDSRPLRAGPGHDAGRP